MVTLEPRELRLLEGLRFSPRKNFPGKVRGERLTKKKGLSIEFSDYREYSEGDDLRHLDWNVLARLGAPLMKTFRDEEDLAVHVLLDSSPSMEFGSPTKLDAARKLAMAVGLIGLGGGDSVQPRILGSNETRSLRGRASYFPLADALSRTDAPVKDISRACRDFIASKASKGLVFLISDGLDEQLPRALLGFGARGHELYFLQVLSDLDLKPDLEGDLRLIDKEGGLPVEITANSLALRLYHERLSAHNLALEEACRKAGGHYALANSNDPLDKTVQGTFRRLGWAR